jgi:Starch-binding associating with outer membrane
MKQKFFKLILPIFALVVVSTGCKRSFLDVNENPNTPTVTDARFVFSNAQNITARILTLTINEPSSMWCGLWAQSNDFIPQKESTLSMSNGDYNFWDGLYDNLADYNYILSNAAKEGSPYLIGPAKVMMAHNFQILVDQYNNIPFEDALKGTDVINPKYQKGQVVYESLITMLNEAIVSLKANSFPAGQGAIDITFGGDIAKWVRFANSLKLRILMRQSLMSGRDAYIQTQLAAISSDGFLLAGENAQSNPGFLKGLNKINPFYNRYGWTDQDVLAGGGTLVRMNALIIDYLKLNSDPRLARLAYPTVSNGTFTGIPLGSRANNLTANGSSGIGPHQIVFGQFANPVMLMSAAETMLLQAEARLRYPAQTATWPSAQTLYTNGVAESFKITGVANPVATAAGVTGPGGYGDYAAAANKYTLIWTQKWIAFTNYNGMEAWSENRRTGVPVIPASLGAPTKPMPLRLLYPTSEINTNIAVVLAEGTIDAFATKIFWDN